MNAEIRYQRNKTAKAKRDSEYQRKRADRYERENVKLREQMVQLQADWESERDYANQMEAKEKKAVAENTKLRMLVRHLYEYRQLYFKTGIYPTDHGVTEQRMRELGVEVV